MKILFIHKNFPAQFGGVALWLAEQGWDVTFATSRAGVTARDIRIVHFEDHRPPSPQTHHYLQGAEQAVISGQALVRTAQQLKSQGYRPDIVVAHSGWGVGTFVKDVWPDTKFVQYAEWYYSYPPVDRTSPAAPGHEMEERARSRARNAPFWLDFSAADATICPTRYQASRFPQKIRHLITVLSDGFDTVLHRPGPRDDAMLEEQGIPKDARIVTYIARGMEPMRGFHHLMKTIERVQKTRLDVHFVIIAEDRVAYGSATAGPTWKERMLAECDLTLSRVHFLGRVPRHTMIRWLQATDTHLYLSAPFILSWSFVDAMACAAPIIAARSEPVAEFMTDAHSGVLVDPADTACVAQAIETLVDAPERAHLLGRNAREEIVAHYDAEKMIFPRHLRFYADLVAGVF